MAGDNVHKNSFTKDQKQLILESIRCLLLTPLDAIVGYSDILDEEFSFENNANENCTLAIKNILKDARALQKMVDNTFSNAMIESQHSNYKIIRFIESLHYTLLTPLYAMIGNYETLRESGLSALGEHIENDCQKIYEAAKSFINSVNKINAAIKTNHKDLSAYLKNLTARIKRVTDEIPTQQNKTHRVNPVPGTILVVDDNTMTLDLWLRQGEFFGYRTIACHDGDQAIDILTKGHIDLVLLQIIMDNANGFNLLEKIRSNENFNNIPVIAISPLKQRELALKCFKMGASDYLAQPLQLAIFKARVNDCIEKKKLLDKEKEYLFNIKKQKEEVEKLMLDSMPSSIVERIEHGEVFIADRSEEASVLFVDIADFSQIVDELSPHQTVRLLNRIFSAIDDIIDKHEVEKIKTIGDSYMAVAGIPKPNHQHAEAIAGVALEILSIIKTINNELGRNIRLRLGISSGPVVAGILGTKKIIYDIWGKTVNLASRIEAQGMPDKIQVSESTYNLLKNNYDFIFKGESDIRGIGPSNIYFLTGRKRKKPKKKPTR